MTVEILDEATAEAAAEQAAGPSDSDLAIDIDDVWIAAALDWDELEGGRSAANRQEAD